MPSHDARRAPDPVPTDRRLSRRSVLRGTAAAGAAGLAAAGLAAAAAGAAASPALAAPGRPAAPDQRTGPSPATLPAGPIVVHVRDGRSGDIEVFAGTSQTSLRDKDLAARIARAIG
jgi:nitrous oxide reductase